MALPDLHYFKDDLAKTPGKGSNAPPVSIRAQDLDDNYKKTTLIESNENPPLYQLEYLEDGTRITRIMPDGANTGDLLYWNGTRWAVLAAPSSDTMHVLTITSGALAWTETEACAE